MMTSWLMLVALVAALPDAEPSAAWKFVVAPANDPFEHPPLRAIGLSNEKPDDLVVKTNFRGARQRYAQLRYGSASSVRVAVVLDEVARGVADLYVDLDRNRRIEDKDRLEADGRTWRTPLDLAIVEGETTRYVHRAAIFRLGATGITFSFAAAGYLEGTVGVGEHKHAARRTDGDGNGLFTDAQDRLWIDLNDDGRWDAATEQFLFASILPIGSARYAVRSDPFGQRLSFEPLVGSGTIRLTFPKRPGLPGAAEVAATLIGRDGSAVGLSGDGAEATVPIGEYRVGTVTCSLEDPQGGQRWNFVFSDIGRRGESPWHKVEKDQSVAIDPIGALAFLTGAESLGPQRPGDELRIEPKLYTGEGLLIVTCYRGSAITPASDSGPSARIALATSDGRTLATAHSGFA
jgi:hypothetical protein